MMMPNGNTITNAHFSGRWFQGLSTQNAIDGDFAALQRNMTTVTDVHEQQRVNSKDYHALLTGYLEDIPLHCMSRVYSVLLACCLRSCRYRVQQQRLWHKKSLLNVRVTHASYHNMICHMLSYISNGSAIEISRYPLKAAFYPSIHVLLDLSRSMANVRIIGLLLAKALLQSYVGVKIYVADDKGLSNVSDALKSSTLSDLTQYAACCESFDKKCFSSVFLDYGVLLKDKTIPKRVCVFSDGLMNQNVDDIVLNIRRLKQQNVDLAWLNPVIDVTKPNLPIISFEILRRELKLFLPAANLHVLQLSIQKFLEQ